MKSPAVRCCHCVHPMEWSLHTVSIKALQWSTQSQPSAASNLQLGDKVEYVLEWGPQGVGVRCPLVQPPQQVLQRTQVPLVEELLLLIQQSLVSLAAGAHIAPGQAVIDQHVQHREEERPQVINTSQVLETPQCHEMLVRAWPRLAGVCGCVCVATLFW